MLNQQSIVIILSVRFNTRRHANLSIPQTDRPRGRLTDHVARNPIASLRASQAKRVATQCASQRPIHFTWLHVANAKWNTAARARVSAGDRCFRHSCSATTTAIACLCADTSYRDVVDFHAIPPMSLGYKTTNRPTRRLGVSSVTRRCSHYRLYTVCCAAYRLR